MSESWFYLADLPESGETCQLDTQQARHASGAKRLHEGQRCAVFDGRGRVGRAEIISIKKGQREVTIRLIDCHDVAPPQPFIHLATALPKGDRQSTLLNMATQLGMSAFTPLVCERSVVTPNRSWRQRSERIMIEACKQCRRAHLPIVHEPVTPDQLDGAAHRILLADRDGPPIQQVVHSMNCESKKTLVLAIGPEGGFTDNERQVMCELDAQPANLGDGVLRIETACIAMLSYVRLALAPNHSTE